jgi:hypothetical protein
MEGAAVSLHPTNQVSAGSACLPFCHPDRSEAKWRDLQFCGPLLEMFFDRTGVQGPSCGLCQDPRSET